MGVSGQRHAPARLYAGERNLGTHCRGGWVGPRASLDKEVREKISFLCRGSNLRYPVVQSVATLSPVLCFANFYVNHLNICSEQQ